MIETVRCVLAECGLERACRLIITANFLDDMRVHLLFNRFGRDAESVLDGQRCAAAMRDDADSVDAEERTAAVIFPIRFLVNGLEGSFDHERTELSRRAFHDLVLEPGKDSMRERLTGLEHDVAEETVA